jgi:hypothetical protein
MRNIAQHLKKIINEEFNNLLNEVGPFESDWNPERPPGANLDAPLKFSQKTEKALLAILWALRSDYPWVIEGLRKEKLNPKEEDALENFFWNLDA